MSISKEKMWFDYVKETVMSGDYETYGLEEGDDILIKQCLNNAKENENKNEFPDFKYQNGWIEHFQITSAYQDDNGSSQLRSSSEAFKKADRTIEKIAKEKNESISSFVTPITTEEHSHDFIKSSLVANMDNHIGSLEQYKNNHEAGIFMICYLDGILSMGESNSSEPEVLHDYYLSRDKELLKYLCDYEDRINFVIFINRTKDVEIINLNNIDEILESMNEYIIIPLQSVIQNIVSIKN